MFNHWNADWESHCPVRAVWGSQGVAARRKDSHAYKLNLEIRVRTNLTTLIFDLQKSSPEFSREFVASFERCRRPMRSWGRLIMWPPFCHTLAALVTCDALTPQTKGPVCNHLWCQLGTPPRAALAGSNLSIHESIKMTPTISISGQTESSSFIWMTWTRQWHLHDVVPPSSPNLRYGTTGSLGIWIHDPTWLHSLFWTSESLHSVPWPR